MKSFLNSLITRKMQIKTTVRYYYIGTRIVPIYFIKRQKWSCIENIEQQEISISCWWQHKLIFPTWEYSLAISIKIRHKHMPWPSKPPPRRRPHRNAYTYVHKRHSLQRLQPHSGPKLESIQILTQSNIIWQCKSMIYNSARTWIDLINVILSERSQSPKDYIFYDSICNLFEVQKQKKLTYNIGGHFLGEQ